MKNPLPGCKYDRPFYYVTLLPVEKPTVEQIKHFREVALGQQEMNFLQLRAILEHGGFAAFGLLLPTQLSALTSALDAVGIRYAVHKDDTPRLLPQEGEKLAWEAIGYSMFKNCNSHNPVRVSVAWSNASRHSMPEKQRTTVGRWAVAEVKAVRYLKGQ